MTPAAAHGFMDAQDLTQIPAVARVTKLRHDLEQSRTPEQTLRALREGFAEFEGLVATMLVSTRGLSPGEFRVLQIEREDDPDEPADGSLGKTARLLKGGVIAEVVSRREPRVFHNVDWSIDPYFHEVLDGCSSIMALPLSGERLPMNWVIMLAKAPRRFDVSDLTRALERAALASSLLENQILVSELARANERIDLEARQVGELQRALLPDALPRIAGLEIAASYEPSGRAGGDLYDCFPLGKFDGDCRDASTRWCVFIADTAGHNLAAAVVMAIVQAVIRAHPAEMARPAKLLMHANRQLCEKRIGGFVTAFLGVYEPIDRRLTYSNAGHPPPLLRRAHDSSIVALDSVASYPLGIDASETFEEATVQFERGDVVLLYTDGITEARSPSDDFFDNERLYQALREGGNGPTDLINHLRQALQKYQQGRPAVDDQTLVAAKVL